MSLWRRKGDASPPDVEYIGAASDRQEAIEMMLESLGFVACETAGFGGSEWVIYRRVPKP